MSGFKKLFYLACIFSVFSQMAHAGVIIGGTRVIFDANKKETNISVRNPDGKPYLIQSWLENATPATSGKPPFIITPPLFRLEAGQENVLRILSSASSLPQDRESLYWLNIKSIPSSDKDDNNRLLVAVKTRMKLLYRPIGLAENASSAYKSLHFTRNGNQVVVINPTPYYLSFYRLAVGGKDLKQPGMVAPNSQISLPLPAGISGSNLIWQTIGDFGNITKEMTAQL